MPQLAPCARAVAQPLAKGSSSVRQISLDQGKDCWPSQLWGGVRPRAPHPQNRKPFETQLHHRCGGLSGVDCRGLGEGKGTQRIRKDARRTKSKKGRKKAPDESDGVNSEGGTAKARALTQLPSLESGEAGPGEGSKGEGEGERRESTAKREGDVSQEGRFATFLYSGIAGLALAGVGWLVAPQAIELLGGKHVESGAFPQVGYEKAAREEKVERIVARQLAQR